MKFNIKNVGFCVVLLFLLVRGAAHPMPNSVVNFSFGKDEMYLKIEVPISEFESAFGKDLVHHQKEITTTYAKEIADYFVKHVRIRSLEGVAQAISFQQLQIHNTTYDFGPYAELVVDMVCKTDATFDNRHFILDYDAVIHQVVTHFAVIRIHQDFENGITPEDSVDVSTIHLDIGSNTIKPLTIKLEKGSQWKGFAKMVSLGMHHIRTGIDHLLFILLLILISPLLHAGQHWGNFGGWKYTFWRLLKIVTAFTLGHSITLGIFSLWDLDGFSKPIEVAITFTIILTAIHCIKPIFANKEVYVTFFFGLIHGSAFGITLHQWGFSKGQKLISLLGFNIGIELMQLAIVLLGAGLIFMSKFSSYKYLRIALATVAIFVCTFWALERITETPNVVTKFVERMVG